MLNGKTLVGKALVIRKCYDLIVDLEQFNIFQLDFEVVKTSANLG